MTEERTPVQIAAVVAGSALLLLGIVGFIGGITTPIGDLKFAGDRPSARIFGVFQISGLHNLAHMLSGIVALPLARRSRTARIYLIGAGVFYLGFWLIGFVNHSSWIPADDADDVLHLALGIGLIALGVFSPGRRR
jgi:hypothetical protein